MVLFLLCLEPLTFRACIISTSVLYETGLHLSVSYRKHCHITVTSHDASIPLPHTESFVLPPPHSYRTKLTAPPLPTPSLNNILVLPLTQNFNIPVPLTHTKINARSGLSTSHNCTFLPTHIEMFAPTVPTPQRTSPC